MNKFFTTAILAATLLLAADAQATTPPQGPCGTADVPELSPARIGKTFDFSPAAQKAFKQNPDNEVYTDVFDIVGSGCSFYCGCDIGTIKASSTLAPQGKRSYKASNIHDLNYETAWVEGVKGDGVDQWIEYTLKADNPPITEICVVGGYVRTKKAWQENSRPAVLEVQVDGKRRCMLYLRDVYAEQWFDVGEIKPTGGKPLKIRFIIKSVYPGTKYADTAISEIYFDGTGVH
ncbi:MAG: hypothetical protein Q4B68_09615 [Bacteroidales bacterium]|nr:hypothetical protein [Bacteroidales bacterium]